MRKGHRAAILAVGTTLAAISLAARGEARDLTEVLQDKGVISRDEKKEIDRTRTKPTISYKEGQGFSLATPDDRFVLTMGGRLQVRYTLLDIDQAYTNVPKGTEDSQSIDIPRARLWWKGNAFTPRLKYEVQIDVVGGGGDILRDALLEYELVDDGWLSGKVGQFKTTFCRQEMTSSGKLQFVDRSLACSNFRFERDRGIQVFGTPWNSLLEYYAGVYNGTGRNGPPNPDMQFLYVTRLAVNPLGIPFGYIESDVYFSEKPVLAIGGSYAYHRARADEFTSAATTGPNPNDPDQTVITTAGQKKNNVPYDLMIQPYYASLANPTAVTAEINALEADIAFRWLGFSLQSEFYKGFVHNTEGGSAAPAAPYKLPQTNFNNEAWYAQVGYFIIPKKLELAFRYSELTPNQDTEVTYPDGKSDTPYQTEMLGAVSWYFAAHNLKVQTDFGPVNSYGTKNTAGVIDDQSNLRWRVQTQLIF